MGAKPIGRNIDKCGEDTEYRIGYNIFIFLKKGFKG